MLAKVGQYSFSKSVPQLVTCFEGAEIHLSLEFVICKESQ